MGSLYLHEHPESRLGTLLLRLLLLGGGGGAGVQSGHGALLRPPQQVHPLIEQAFLSLPRVLLLPVHQEEVEGLLQGVVDHHLGEKEGSGLVLRAGGGLGARLGHGGDALSPLGAEDVLEVKGEVEVVGVGVGALVAVAGVVLAT